MEEYKTEQENFWAGQFGTEYVSRNDDAQIISKNISLFSQIICSTKGVSSILELGANIGFNILALKQLLPSTTFSAVEINRIAFDKLRMNSWIHSYNESILTFQCDEKFDLVFTKGVLIHINPSELETIYEKLYNLTRKYILIVEYYSPFPVEINYRGYSNKLFKRDFAGELLKKYSNLELVNYGFSYHLDPNFPQDDLNWFLLEKMEIKQ